MQQHFPTLIEKCLSSYVENRTVHIRDEEGKYGEIIKLESGVTQGDILSPLQSLFYNVRSSRNTRKRNNYILRT